MPKLQFSLRESVLLAVAICAILALIVQTNKDNFEKTEFILSFDGEASLTTAGKQLDILDFHLSHQTNSHTH